MKYSYARAQWAGPAVLPVPGEKAPTCPHGCRWPLNSFVRSFLAGRPRRIASLAPPALHCATARPPTRAPAATETGACFGRWQGPRGRAAVVAATLRVRPRSGISGTPRPHRGKMPVAAAGSRRVSTAKQKYNKSIKIFLDKTLSYVYKQTAHLYGDTESLSHQTDGSFNRSSGNVQGVWTHLITCSH